MHRNVKDASDLYLSNEKAFVHNLKSALQAAQPWAEFEKEAAKKSAEALFSRCEDIARDRKILDRFGKALEQRGVAGVSRKAKLLYLVVTTRLLARIVSAGVKAASSVGKSFLVGGVLDFFPNTAYYVLTAMSDKTLAYTEEPLSHRFVVLYEAAALANNWPAYFVRSLMSEGRLIYETVEKTSTGLRSRRIEKEGPTGLLTTTTAINLNPENETRSFSLRLDDSATQTKRIIAAEAAKVSGECHDADISDEEFFGPWRDYQSWLELAERRVVIPFALTISELVPPVAVRLRRDFPAVMRLVQAHALLHQISRERVQQGRILATLEDYEEVRKLVQDVMAEATEQSVAAPVRDTVKAVKQVCSAKQQRSDPDFYASIEEVAKTLRLDRSAASRRIHACLEAGYLETTEPIKKGRTMRLLVGEPLPGDQSVLPSCDEIRRHLPVSHARRRHVAEG